jgi:septal ring factor EnvC (AmiA/AmiB activator)
MLRRIATLATASLLALGFFAGTAAQASTTEAARCDAMLIELAEKQEVLAELQAAVEKGKADREALAQRASELAQEIASAKADGKDATALEQRRADALAELADLEAIAPAVAAQTEALAAEVDAAERGYIACVDATLS